MTPFYQKPDEMITIDLKSIILPSSPDTYMQNMKCTTRVTNGPWGGQTERERIKNIEKVI
jgi:hypothetical protein